MKAATSPVRRRHGNVIKPVSACLCHFPQASADSSQLARSLAEGMNTPLGTVSAHAEEALCLLQQWPSRKLAAARHAELQEHLRLIMQEARRCSRIAGSLLQVLQPISQGVNR
jgi:hypothetical protein